MSWFRVESSVRTHPKIAKLARRLGVCIPHARGLVTGLWAWACDTAPDGNLSSYDSEDLSIAAEWDGKPDDLYQALLDVRLLEQSGDGVLIHDWMERAEGYKRAQNEANRRAQKEVQKKEPGMRAPRVHHACNTRAPDGDDGQDREDRDDGSAAAAEADFWIPVRGSIEPWAPKPGDVDDWRKAYPRVPVDEELRKMREWSISNPEKQPSFRTARNFVTSWLNREQRRLEDAARKEEAADAAKSATSEPASAGQGAAAHRKFDLPDTSGAVPPPAEVKELIAKLAGRKALPRGPPKDTAQRVNDRRNKLRRQAETKRETPCEDERSQRSPGLSAPTFANRESASDSLSEPSPTAPG